MRRLRRRGVCKKTHKSSHATNHSSYLEGAVAALPLASAAAAAAAAASCCCLNSAADSGGAQAQQHASGCIKHLTQQSPATSQYSWLHIPFTCAPLQRHVVHDPVHIVRVVFLLRGLVLTYPVAHIALAGGGPTTLDLVKVVHLNGRVVE